MEQLPDLSGGDISDEATYNDVSNGLEPIAIPVTGLSAQNLKSLSRFEQYIIDSILPDGRSISKVSLSSSELSASEEHNSDDEGSEGGCGCRPSGEVTRTCSRADGGECDCVGDYGNFYNALDDNSGGKQTLNIDALPDKWPLVECSSECSCYESCSNKVTQRGVSVPLSVRPVTEAGLGLFYTPSDSATLPRGSFISLYAGEYLTTPEARLRWSCQDNNAPPGEGNYILSLRLPDLIVHIDPRRKGNVGRFLNHSCDPNCLIQIVRWGAGSWPRAAIFTKREIHVGEELKFDYGNASGNDEVGNGEIDDQEIETRTKCYCGSGRCRGWMPFDETL